VFSRWHKAKEIEKRKSERKETNGDLENKKKDKKKRDKEETTRTVRSKRRK
jgi:hypothetical protein